jgi:hypothetical protein
MRLGLAPLTAAALAALCVLACGGGEPEDSLLIDPSTVGADQLAALVPVDELPQSFTQLEDLDLEVGVPPGEDPPPSAAAAYRHDDAFATFTIVAWGLGGEEEFKSAVRRTESEPLLEFPSDAAVGQSLSSPACRGVFPDTVTPPPCLFRRTSDIHAGFRSASFRHEDPATGRIQLRDVILRGGVLAIVDLIDSKDSSLIEGREQIVKALDDAIVVLSDSPS